MAGERAEWLKGTDSQRTCIWFSEVALGRSPLELTLAPADVTPSSGFCGHTHKHTHTKNKSFKNSYVHFVLSPQTLPLPCLLLLYVLLLTS